MERIATLRRTHGATVGSVRNRSAVEKEYKTWVGIQRRCENPHQPGYKDYGARGIRMCDRWRGDYRAFVADMGRAPSPMHSIERIDNGGNYEPGNCRWAAPREQARNRRSSVKIQFEGDDRLLIEVAEQFGISYNALYCAVISRKESADLAVERLKSR